MVRRIVRLEDTTSEMTIGKDLEGNVIEIPLTLLTHQQVGLAADALAVVYTAPYNILISAAMLKWAAAVYIEAHIEASHVDSVTDIELYDVTAALVRGAASANAGARVRSADILAALVAGNEHTVRITVTTASATAGATTGCRRASLIIVFAVE